MATFQVVVGDPETGEAHGFEVDGQEANRFIGREIGEEVDRSAVGLAGYTLEITGGSDAAGRPLRADVAGANLTEVLVSGRSTGYRPDREGERRRITVRGREVGDEVVQINARIVERGEQSVGELLGGGDDGGGGDDEGDAAGEGEEEEAEEEAEDEGEDEAEEEAAEEAEEEEAEDEGG